MNQTQQFDRAASKMGVGHIGFRSERFTRSEAIERAARFNVAGMFLIDAQDGNDFRQHAQTVLNARMLPDEWAAVLEAHGVALWNANRAIFHIFDEAGYARRTDNLLSDGHISDEGFQTEARKLGSEVLNSEDQGRLLGQLLAHRDAFNAAVGFAESMLTTDRPTVPPYDMIPDPEAEIERATAAA